MLFTPRKCWLNDDVFAYRADSSAESVQQATGRSNMATTGTWTTPEIENSSSARSCEGAVILLADDYGYVAAGSSVALDCRAVGTAGIHWVLPGHKVGTRWKNAVEEIQISTIKCVIQQHTMQTN